MDLAGKKVNKGYAVIVKEHFWNPADVREKLLGIYASIDDAKNKMFEYHKYIDPDPMSYVSNVSSDRMMLSITSVDNPSDDCTILTIKEAAYII